MVVAPWRLDSTSQVRRLGLGSGRAALVEECSGHRAAKLAPPPEDGGDAEGAFVIAVQGVLPGEPDPAVDLDGPLAGGDRCLGGASPGGCRRPRSPPGALFNGPSRPPGQR